MAITQNKATSQLVERLQNAKITEERREAGVFLQDKEVVLGDPDCRGVSLGQFHPSADLHDLLGTVILYHLELQQEDNPVQTANRKSIAMINALQPNVMTQVKSSAQTIWTYLRKSLSLLEEEQIPAYVHSLCSALFEGQSNRSQTRALNPMALCTLLSLLEAVELDGRLRVDQVMPKFSEANRLRLVRSIFTHWKDEISPMSGTMAAEGEAYMSIFNERNFLGKDEIRRALIKEVRIPSLLKVEEEDTAYFGWNQSNRSWHVLCRDWNRPLLDWWRVLRTQARFQEGQSLATPYLAQILKDVRAAEA